MSYPRTVPYAELTTRAEVVIEGKVAHAYYDFIPGVAPRTLGVHFLLDSQRLVKFSKSVFSRNDLWGQVGFWAYPGQVRCVPGDRVIAHLVRHINPERYMTLMPYPCTDGAVVHADTGLSCHRPKAHARHIPDLPARYVHFVPLWEPDDGMMHYFGAFPGTVDDVGPALDAWRGAWTANSPLSHDHRCVDADFSYAHHFRIGFVPHIAPTNPTANEPLAVTLRFIPPPGASGFSDQMIAFNRSFNWSPPGQQPVADPTLPANDLRQQFDFRTVLTHELGHSLGLDHIDNTASPDNVMTHDIPPLTVRTLQPDDIAAITALY
ncbi:---NA--- : : Peptidase_M10 [Gemmataceae bacterium]|nr:---NA--- : : Peptidase_M10 [Gemmataceae bacterium]VTU01010.1 ---NA--- : : Peptidase_M10 [Gemmataceae bacterium]